MLLLVFTAPGLAQPINIKIQSAISNSVESRAIDYLIKLIVERSNGRVQIQRLPDSDDVTEHKAILEQQIQMGLLNSASLRQELPLLELFELPFLYTDRQQLHNILDSDIGRQILQSVSRQGLKPLCFWDESFLQLAADRGLMSPQQVSGLSFSNRQSPLDKIFTGVERDTGSAEEVFEVSLGKLAAGQFEPPVTDLTLSNHAATGALLLVNQDFWGKLPDDLKVIISGAVKDTTTYARELISEADRLALQKLEKSGRYRLHRLTPEQWSAWQKGVMQIYRQQFNSKELQFIEIILRS